MLGSSPEFFLPVYLLAAAAFDPSELTNTDYLKVVLARAIRLWSIGSNGAFPLSARPIRLSSLILTKRRASPYWARLRDA
jgi:hypothetical protein